MKSFYIRTFGCKVNQYESQSIREALLKQGLTAACSEAEADWVIVNTCAVTSVSAAKSRQAVRKAFKMNPSSRIAVIGCGINAEAERFTRMKAVAFIAENRDKRAVIDYIANTRTRENSVPGKQCEGVSGLAGRTRAFLKVQDGCNRFCSYCIVPHLRGAPTSRQGADITEEVKRIVDNGVREIVLTGINLGLYGSDRGGGGDDLTELVEQVKQVMAPARLRLSSLHCSDVTDSLLDSMACDGICPHLHLSLQSGSNRILKAMNRTYDREEYLNVVARAREKMRDLAVTTDLIVGFPGETEKDFEESLELLQAARISRTTFFPLARERERARRGWGERSIKRY